MKQIDYRAWADENLFWDGKDMKELVTAAVIAHCKCHGTPYTAVSSTIINCLRKVRKKYLNEH